MSVVRVKEGWYRGMPLINREFKLVRGFTMGKKANFITVENTLYQIGRAHV